MTYANWYTTGAKLWRFLFCNLLCDTGECIRVRALAT